MSWDAYVTNLKATGHIAEAAVVGMDGSVWASSEGLKCITTEEIKKLKEKNMSFMVCGKKYLTLVQDDDMIQMKEVIGENGVKRNISVGRAKTCMVIGVGTAEASGGSVSAEVGKIRDYLVTNGM